jgi:hypothetical protein
LAYTGTPIESEKIEFFSNKSKTPLKWPKMAFFGLKSGGRGGGYPTASEGRICVKFTKKSRKNVKKNVKKREKKAFL